MIPFTERLKATFDALDTTPYKFAGRYDFNRASMFNMLSGRNRPNLDMLERICGAEPRISAEYLLRGEGDPLRDARLAMTLTTVEELKGFKVEINQSLDRRIKELGGEG